MNTRCSRENTILQHSTFDSALKRVASIENQREFCLHFLWVQRYQWHLPHPFCLLFFQRIYNFEWRFFWNTLCKVYNTGSPLLPPTQWIVPTLRQNSLVPLKYSYYAYISAALPYLYIFEWFIHPFCLSLRPAPSFAPSWINNIK